MKYYKTLNTHGHVNKYNILFIYLFPQICLNFLQQKLFNKKKEPKLK